MNNKEYYINEIMKVNSLLDVTELVKLSTEHLQDIYYYYLTKGI